MLVQKLREQLADAIFKNKHLEKRVAAFEWKISCFSASRSLCDKP